MRHAHAKIVPVAVAALLLAAGFSFASPTRTKTAPVPKRAIDNVTRIRAELRGSIAEIGTRAAYEALALDAASDDTATSHGKAHVFGELLHEAEGIAGISLCDERFTFGCYHGLIARALAEEGPGALPDIDAACAASAAGGDDTGCMHGVGHGLVEHFSPRDVASALDACERLRPPSLLGCTQGVFMEYATAVREGALPAPNDAREPCASVPPRHQPSCWFEQPHFWRRLFAADDAAIAGRCAALSGAERDACLLGFGRMAVELSGYSRDAHASACAHLGAEDRVACIGGAHWLLAAVKKERPWPCDDLPTDERRACVAASKRISDVGQ